MRAIIAELTEQQQQEVGRLWLLALWGQNLPVDGVHVEFEELADEK